jgi:PKD repeat protein
MITAPCCTRAYWPPLPNVTTTLDSTNSNQRRVSFSVYDPILGRVQSADSGWFSADTVWVFTNAGVVQWESQSAGATTLGFSVYDPNLGAWQTANTGPLTTSVSQVQTKGGIVAWRERIGTFWNYFNASTYDPGVQRWITQRSGLIDCDSTDVGCLEGIATFQEQHSSPGKWYAHCWILDPLQHEWRTARFGPYTSSTWMIGFEQGSIRLYVGSQHYLKGYDYLSGNWSDGATRPLAAFRASSQAGIVPLVACFTDLSLGAGGWTWSFGDGSNQTTNVSPSHAFMVPGTNLVTLTVSGLGGTASTNLSIRVAPRPRLELTGVSNGICQLRLVAAPASIHILETSTNLNNWEPAQWITNSSGAVAIQESANPACGRTFFRTRQIWQ